MGGCGGAKPADDERDEECRQSAAEFFGNDDGDFAADIRADAHESRVPERQLTEEPDDYRKRHGENDAYRDFEYQFIRRRLEPAGRARDRHQ